MRAYRTQHARSGLSLVELLVVIGVMTVVFAGIFGSLQLMFKVVAHSKAESGALALARSGRIVGGKRPEHDNIVRLSRMYRTTDRNQEVIFHLTGNV